MSGTLVPGHGHIVKMQYSSPLLFYTGESIREIKIIVIMTKEGSTKIANM